jgi:hypothetical protein
VSLGRDKWSAVFSTERFVDRFFFFLLYFNSLTRLYAYEISWAVTADSNMAGVGDMI